MAVTAEIKAGDRSVISYFLYRISSSRSFAGSTRLTITPMLLARADEVIK